MDNILNRAKQLAYSSEETLIFSYDCAVKMKDTDGDYVECGVAAGAQIMAMAAGAPDKIIHAFDSFEGIPLPSNRDNQMPGIRALSKKEISKLPAPGKQLLKSTGATSISIKDFVNNITTAKINTDNIIVHPGWFENTVSKTTIEKISILRLDGDLYNSTYVCLKHLFPLVITGGIVIIDDWQLSGCRAACKDYFKEINFKPQYLDISNIKYFIK